MNRREIIIFSFIFLLATVLTVDLVFGVLTNRRLLTFNNPNTAQTTHLPSGTLTNRCGTAEKLPITSPTQTSLKKLSDYQEICQSSVTTKLMLFEQMPKDSNDAQTMAAAMASRLIEHSQNGIAPIVIVEPVSTWGLIDYTEFGGGFYDSWIGEYFDAIKAAGVTDTQMGVWVPFPEANLPYWNNQNATPEDFAAVVNRYLSIMKNRFPTAKGSVLLNSATYSASDFDWQNGEYVSLLPYVSKLDKKYVDSFGLQGFPWMPNAKQVGPGVFDAREYLNTRLAIEAANSLGTKEIWFNTGSFRAKYTLDPALEVSVSPAKRKDILNGITDEVLRAKNLGYTVSINLFSEDKSKANEGTDWSYLGTPEDERVFVGFVSRLNSLGIGLSLFDQ